MSIVRRLSDRAPVERDVSVQQQHSAPLEPQLASGVARNMWSLRDPSTLGATHYYPTTK